MTNVLLVAAFVISGLAVLRGRWTTFLFAANQIAILRALANIETYGQPVSQGMLPAALFGADRLSRASEILTIPTAFLLASVLWPTRSTPPLRTVPRPPLVLVLLAIAQVLAMVASTKTILYTPYAAPDQTIFENPVSGGIQVLAAGVLILAGLHFVLTGRLTPIWATGILFLVLIATDYSKGTTALASGIGLTGAAAFFTIKDGSPRASLKVAGVILILLTTAATVRGARALIHQDGGRAVESLLDRFAAEEANVAGRGEGAEQIGNGSQYAAHLLECISLYDSGLDRQWRSVYSPLEYTIKPSFAVKALGLERSQEAAWELADHFIHGGGIYIWGELYWNGGFLCVSIVGAALIMFAFFCDTRYRTSVFWLILFLQFAPGLLQGVGYGFAQVARGIINGLLLVFLFFLLRRGRSFGPAETVAQEGRA